MIDVISIHMYVLYIKLTINTLWTYEYMNSDQIQLPFCEVYCKQNKTSLGFNY